MPLLEILLDDKVSQLSALLLGCEQSLVTAGVSFIISVLEQ